MNKNAIVMVDWDAIDTVFLDMDGTLLDLEFDAHFWYRHLPQRFAEAYGLEFEEAKQDLTARYRAMRGTLQWYCADYWSTELGLDVAALKREIQHRVTCMPHAEEFLTRVNESGRFCYLVTNAHPEFVAIKMEESKIQPFFRKIVSSHDFKTPKESQEFWKALHTVITHDPARTLMVDDDLDVLRHAQAAGIGCLITVRQPNRSQPERQQLGFPAIRDFSDIMPPSPGPSA